MTAARYAEDIILRCLWEMKEYGKMPPPNDDITNATVGFLMDAKIKEEPNDIIVETSGISVAWLHKYKGVMLRVGEDLSPKIVLLKDAGNDRFLTAERQNASTEELEFALEFNF